MIQGSTERGYKKRIKKAAGKMFLNSKVVKREVNRY